MDDQKDMFNLDEGRKLRDEGMETAKNHADRVEENWSDQAYDLLMQFLEEECATGFQLGFMTEDVRVWAHAIKDFPFPPDGRAWGSVIMKAVKNGLIRRRGYAPMKSKNCHANPKSVWERRL